MRHKSLLLPVCLLLPFLALRAEPVQSILARMDQAAPNFKGMSADVTMVTFTAILNDSSTQKGTVKMQRVRPGETRAVMDFSADGKGQVFAFLGKIVRVYYPDAKTYQDLDVGKNSQEVNQYLLLGFGSSGKELEQSYAITPESTEKVAGLDTTKLLLVPKDSKVKERLMKVEMWIPVGQVSPIKQRFYEPSGNYRETTYSNLQINPPMPGKLDFKLPPGATKQS